MTARLSLGWVADTTDPGIAIDPYSHWLLVHGRPFFARGRAFNHVGVVLAGEGFETLLKTDFVTVERIGAGGRLLDDIAKRLASRIAGNADGEKHVFVMPLPDRSITGAAKVSAVDRGAGRRLQLSTAIDPIRPLVITGVIDDHVNVFHDTFKAADGTRIDFAWFQDGARPGDRAADDGQAPSFGLEITKADIDGATGPEHAKLRTFGLVDFRGREANPLAFRASHGTHVADIAAGSAGRGAGDSNWRIVTVSLPSRVTFDTSGATLGPFFLAGMQYIIRRARSLARALGRRATLVINCSYGISGGPHDGGHFIERAMEALAGAVQDGSDPDLEALSIVLPAGNSNLGRGHAAVAAVSGIAPTELALPWRLHPGDQTASYLEIWLPPEADAQSVSIAVVPPGGHDALYFDAPSGARLLCADGLAEPGRVVARVHRSSAGGRVRFVVAVAPTAGLDPALLTAPHGVWKVTVAARIPVGCRIEAWIQRDTSPMGARIQGRQSYFDDPRYARFDAAGRARADDPPENISVVRRRGTLSGIATGTRAVVVAGYPGDREGIGAADYSASGFGDGRDPTVAALSDRSRVVSGVLAAGTLSGTRVSINGSSVAAPAVARRIARHALSGAPGLPQLFDTPRPAESADSDRVGAGWLTPDENDGARR